MAPPSSIYFYKMTHDDGGAPCVHGRLLSLAICKPKIRRTAAVGSLIFGFGGQELGERLIYAAIVKQRLEKGAYYRMSKYFSRPDCIYRDHHGSATLASDARFHKDPHNLTKDVGPNFEKGDVLLCDDFRYLGGDGTCDYKLACPLLVEVLTRMRRGHRVHHSPAVRKELENLARELWRQNPTAFRIRPSNSMSECTRVNSCL